MKQATLFAGFRRDDPPAALGVDPRERPRLSRQCGEILDLLRAGPVSNQALSAIALKYTSRISDLRAAGYAVECYERDRVTGAAWYRLA